MNKTSLKIEKNLSANQISKLKEKGYIVEAIYGVDCHLCGKKFEGNSAELVDDNLSIHLDENCESVKFLAKFKPETTGAEIARYIKLLGKLQGKGKFSKKDGNELMALSAKIKKE